MLVGTHTKDGDHGNEVTKVQNGFTTMNVISEKLGTEGQFGFQLHANLDMTLWLRNLEWSEVPGTTPVVSSGESSGRKKLDRLIMKAAGGKAWIQLPEGFCRAEVHTLDGKRLWSGRSLDANLAIPAGTESGALMVRFLP